MGQHKIWTQSYFVTLSVSENLPRQNCEMKKWEWKLKYRHAFPHWRLYSEVCVAFDYSSISFSNKARQWTCFLLVHCPLWMSRCLVRINFLVAELLHHLRWFGLCKECVLMWSQSLLDCEQGGRSWQPFGEGKKRPYKFSSSVYLLFLPQKRRFCA